MINSIPITFSVNLYGEKRINCMRINLLYIKRSYLKKKKILPIGEALINQYNMLYIDCRLSLANALYDNPSLPRRKLLLSTGGQNYRPPLERSKSAPKLSAIEEDTVAEEMEQQRLLEELRTLENVAHSWEDQDGWRIAARFLDVLNRESSDENGSISSGCETASSAASEERTSGPEERLMHS